MLRNIRNYDHISIFVNFIKWFIQNCWKMNSSCGLQPYQKVLSFISAYNLILSITVWKSNTKIFFENQNSYTFICTFLRWNYLTLSTNFPRVACFLQMIRWLHVQTHPVSSLGKWRPCLRLIIRMAEQAQAV